ncbi:MAG: V-type ATP synthase subunit E [Candidatus Peregrinibacteria bacterium]
MALVDILERINHETAKQIAQLEKSFEEKKRHLEEDNKTRQKTIDEKMHDKIEENSKKILEKAESLAERERKNRLLAAKRQAIDETLALVVEKLSKADDYEDIITKMLKASDLEEENTVVVSAKGKEEATKTAIKKSGKAYFLSDKSSDLKGGFILKTDRVEVDNSFETIINEQLRSDLEIKLHKTLFG